METLGKSEFLLEDSQLTIASATDIIVISNKGG